MLPANKTAVHGVRKGIPHRTSGQSAARPQRPAKAPSHMTCPVNVSAERGLSVRSAHDHSLNALTDPANGGYARICHATRDAGEPETAIRPALDQTRYR